MGRVISVHEYVLRDGVTRAQFERAVREAEERNLFDLPGLETYHFVEGIRGVREGRYAAIWIYESKAAWEALWGSEGDPIDKAAYPERWRVWEDEVLAPLLVDDPDRIDFTSYEVFATYLET